jgi:hypothetical protein
MGVEADPFREFCEVIVSGDSATAMKLLEADPNALDNSGVAPLHRAVRNRCALVVSALLAGGADPRAPNRNGSTPLLLATQTTGRSGSGSPEARAAQKEILRLLDPGAMSS